MRPLYWHSCFAWKGYKWIRKHSKCGDDSTNISWNVSGQTEIFREESPDGKYTLKIDEIGTPDFPFGNSHLEITLFEMPPEDERPGLYYCASLRRMLRMMVQEENMK